MESPATSAGISWPSSSFVPLSIFFNKRTRLSSRSLPLQFSSKNGEDGHDLNSNAEDRTLVPLTKNQTPLSHFSQDAAMGLILSAAARRGRTTGSGMEGPSSPESDPSYRPISTFPSSLFTKSPRRRMRVAFTCSVCDQRTIRAINPHAYTDGTVFVQCCGCNVFHKLVDNLNLFHEMKCYVSPTFRYKGGVRFDFLDGDDDGGNTFPVL